MANIRASGFDSKDELQEHLLELVPDNEPASSSAVKQIVVIFFMML